MVPGTRAARTLSSGGIHELIFKSNLNCYGLLHLFMRSNGRNKLNLLCRIKPKQGSASPRPGMPKQIRAQAGGFTPFRPTPGLQALPTPGKMEVVEVGRQGEPIVFDNSQEIITAPRIVKNPNSNSFSIDVKATLKSDGRRSGPNRPTPRPPGPGRRVERRRSIHLPSPVARYLIPSACWSNEIFLLKCW